MPENTDSLANSKMADVYDKIKSDIIKGRWEPGKKLSIAKLRDEYDISLSPLREALSKLAAVGFILAEKQRGFRVADISKKELLDLSRMRIQLESWAIKESIERGDKVWESEVIAAFHRLDRTPYESKDNPGNPSGEWVKCHKEFHFALVSGCESNWLMKFRDILFDEMDRYRNLSIEYLNKRRAMNINSGKSEADRFDNDHKKLVDAILDGDSDVACALIEAHFANTVNIICKVLDGEAN